MTVARVWGAAALAAVALFSLGGEAFAHGGVSMEDDRCILKVGPYRAHFAGYLPEERASNEFCEDIPVTGKAIIVIDVVDTALREMEMDVRILRDVNEIGNNATFEDLGSDDAIEAATLLYEPGQIYPTGSVAVRYRFAEEGRYIGLVTARKPGSDEVLRSVFPFSVGVADTMKYVQWVIGILALGVFLYVFSDYWTRRSKQPAA